MAENPDALFVLQDAPEPHPESGKGGEVDLLSLNLHQLGEFMADLGEKRFRTGQVYKWLHQRGARSLDEMTDLKKELRGRMAEQAALRSPSITQVQKSADGTCKFQLETFDGHLIESVFIPDASGPGRNALCISSQVGCAMGCTFCATAALKLKRNLNAGEIVGQLYQVHRWLMDEGWGEKSPRPITNIVYMGMGEPLHNIEGVIGSIGLLRVDEGMGYSGRRITVSTSGLVPQISRLGEETDVHIAISLNATTDEVRDRIMPVNRRWKIEDLLKACRDFPLQARRRITFEYVMLAGENDSDADAGRLVTLMQGMKSKVNLIPFNPHPLSDFERPSGNRVAKFQRILQDGGLSVFVRTTRGDDIDAACGMLGAKKLEEARAAPAG
jgi:23S rRNA (adenine2503-C2)-methyltransferase